MSKRMLIDASHPEETRVVILSGSRVEEFDFESASRRPLKGNIFLAKVTRVEPSLQAAFVEYGGNRHGFLAFSEIHPDYYQIPVADRQALLAAQRAEERRQRDDDDKPEAVSQAPTETGDDPLPTLAEAPEDNAALAAGFEAAPAEAAAAVDGEQAGPDAAPAPQEAAAEAQPAAEAAPAEGETTDEDPAEGGNEIEEVAAQSTETEVVSSGEDDTIEEEEVEQRRRSPRMRQYKIQEVIKKRQILLIQVVKEERGNKGAALTTYLSLAGRYCVLMPNSGRGGGISRKITNSSDRRRLKDAAESLDVPEGMGLIVRTAGASRTKQEIQRDYEYLLRLWDSIRDLTLRSSAPALVYEEGNLIKRAIRDQFSKDIEEIVVEGDEGFEEASAFTKMIMPQQIEAVKKYEGGQSLFQRYKVENQLDSMFNPRVQLKSGGYIVINQTEALVAIDVNSGRSTREHHIEDTALKTNIEAAEEVARQLRLRDLAGLIVIDFIDMDEKRNNRTVESRLKSALRNDRARIQVGRISHFGLMEMSRQRIRTSVLESSTEKCPHCGGTGHVRSVSSVALQLLRALEETLQKGATHNQIVRTRPDTALYVLNHKRAHLRALEERYQIAITIDADESVGGTVTYAIDRGEQVMTPEQAKAVAAQYAAAPHPEFEDEDEPEIDAGLEAEETGSEAESEERADGERRGDEETGDDETPAQAGGENDDGEREGGRKRRRRRRGRGGERNGERREHEPSDQPSFTHETVAEHEVAHLDAPDGESGEDAADAGETRARAPEGEDDNGEPRRRRRGRRGGRRNRRDRDEQDSRDFGEGPHQDQPAEQPHPYEQAQQPYPAAPEADEPPASEPVAAFEAPAAPAAPVAQQQAPVPAEQPAPRRRSTVREPAPVFGDSAPAATPAPAPAPVPEPAPATLAAPEADDAAKPRRTGWWAKRLLGGDKS